MQNLTDSTRQKINQDSSTAIETSILVNPEPLSEMSPSLPEDFPSELIPKNKCELEMLGLLKCMIENKYDNVPCENFQLEFYSCKKFRDSSLFELVKQWECSKFEKFNSDKRKYYMEKLLVEKAKLLEKYDEVPVTSKSIGFRRRIDNDIQQLSWRIEFLPKCLI